MSPKPTARRAENAEQNRAYDRATDGETSPDTAPSSGGRGIDQLKTNLAGSPLGDFDDPTDISEDE